VEIEVLGAGCPKCEALAANVEKAIGALGVDAKVVKVTDIVRIAERGVLLTPALALDGEVVSSGKVASVEEIKTLLSKA